MNITILSDNTAIIDDGRGFPGTAHVTPDYCGICHARLVNHYGDGPCEHKTELDDLMNAGIPAENAAADVAQRHNEQRGA